MDSLTQIVLGAAVGELILGKQLGNKAILLGAIGGTLPDLDVLSNLYNDDPVEQLRIHRAYSHSMFVHLLIAYPITLLHKKLSKIQISATRIYAFWSLALITHALLDSCTTYGTRLLLPFTDYQVAFNNISVIDPLYTIPFLICIAVLMFFKRNTLIRQRWLYAGIGISSMYMLLTFGLKWKAHQLFSESLEKEKITHHTLNTTPTILNSVLWSATAFDDTMIHIGEYSFLKPEEPIHWISYPRNDEAIQSFACEDLETLQWFADGSYFSTVHEKDSITFFAIKFGRMRYDTDNPRDAFMFYSVFSRNENGTISTRMVEPEKINFKDAFRMLTTRIGI